MATFMIVRLPSHPKSLELVEFLQNNDFFYRISTNLPLMNYALSSGVGENHQLAATMGLSQNFEECFSFSMKTVLFQMGTEEIHLREQLTNIFTSKVKVEVDVDDVFLPHKGVVKEECNNSRNDESSGDNPGLVDVPTENSLPLPMAEQGVHYVLAENSQRQAKGLNFLVEGGGEGDEQRMELVDDQLFNSINADDLALRQHRLPHDEAPLHFEDPLNDELQTKDGNASMTKECSDGEEDIKNEDKENIGDNEEELVEDQEDEENTVEEDKDSSYSEEDASSDEEYDDVQEPPRKKMVMKKKGQQSGNPVGRLLFACPAKDCDCSFKKFSEFEDHMELHSEEQEFCCDACKNSFSSKEDAITHIHKREKKDCCGCEKNFRDARNLLHHLRKHTGEKPCICETCGQGFSLPIILNAHMVKHTGEKPYKCDQCGKSFARRQDFRTHQRKHTGEKPYKCKYCDFKCIDRSNLINHTRHHTGERPHSCDQCEKRFVTTSDLKSHKMTHGGEKPFNCEECGKGFIKRSGLAEHMYKHTGEKLYPCPKCEKKFTRNPHLKSHMARKHQA